MGMGGWLSNDTIFRGRGGGELEGEVLVLEIKSNRIYVNILLLPSPQQSTDIVVIIIIIVVAIIIIIIM